MLASNGSAPRSTHTILTTDYVSWVVLNTLEVGIHFTKYQFFLFTQSAIGHPCFLFGKVKASVVTITVITSPLTAPHHPCEDIASSPADNSSAADP